MDVAGTIYAEMDYENYVLEEGRAMMGVVINRQSIWRDYYETIKDWRDILSGGGFYGWPKRNEILLGKNNPRRPVAMLAVLKAYEDQTDLSNGATYWHKPAILGNPKDLPINCTIGLVFTLQLAHTIIGSWEISKTQLLRNMVLIPTLTYLPLFTEALPLWCIQKSIGRHKYLQTEKEFMGAPRLPKPSSWW